MSQTNPDRDLLDGVLEDLTVYLYEHFAETRTSMLYLLLAREDTHARAWASIAMQDQPASEEDFQAVLSAVGHLVRQKAMYPLAAFWASESFLDVYQEHRGMQRYDGVFIVGLDASGESNGAFISANDGLPSEIRKYLDRDEVDASVLNVIFTPDGAPSTTETLALDLFHLVDGINLRNKNKDNPKD